MFGPIVCGTLGGCGGAFFPLSKGLEPLREGVSGPMTTAFLGSAGLHLFVNDPFEVFQWCSDREEVGAICVSLLFVGASLSKFYKVIKEQKEDIVNAKENLRVKNRELRNVRALSQVIIDQRSEVE